MAGFDRISYFLRGRFGAMAVFIGVVFIAGHVNAESPKTELSIDYSGRLFGYYRIEANQPIPTGAAPTEDDLLLPVKNFLNRKEKADLLVGMGDNFGPEFGASIQQVFNDLKPDPIRGPCNMGTEVGDPKDPKSWKKFPPENMYKSDERMPALADCDNVARFLMEAGYRAIVPGREDFLYSGTWLRRIARLLRGASEKGDAKKPNRLVPKNGPWAFGKTKSPDNRLHMLAGNLRVTVSASKTPAGGGDKSCPLLFAYDLASRADCGQGDASISSAMFWLGRVDQALDPTIRASLTRQSSNNTRFAMQLAKNEAQVLISILGNTSEVKTLAEALKKFAGAKTDDQSNKARIEAAEALKTYNVPPKEGKSLTENLEKLRTMTKDFDLRIAGMKNARESPLLSEAALRAAQELLLLQIAEEEEDIGYTVAKTEKGQSVLIIGVVGKETMQEVSPGNFAVYPDGLDCIDDKDQGVACTLFRKLYKTSRTNPDPRSMDKEEPFAITAGDPLQAAEFILRAAWFKYGSALGRVVLMAQMPPSEAEVVAAHLRADMKDGAKNGLTNHPRVDLILSEAQPDFASTIKMQGHDPEDTTPVFSPIEAYIRLSDTRPNPLTRATLLPDTAEMTLTADSTEAAAETRHWAWISNTPEYAPEAKEKLSGNAVPNHAKPWAGCKLPSQIIDGGQSNPYEPWTAACLLERALETSGPIAQAGPFPHTDLTKLWAECGQANRGQDNKALHICQNTVLMRYLLHELQQKAGTDLAVLKRRDFWFNELQSGYDDYAVCENWVPDPEPAPSDLDFIKRYCKLHVALDRVLWKGDYIARALVDGTTLTAMMKTAKQETGIETTLLPNDLHQEWLTTFGITSTPPTNLVAEAAGPESFSVPGVSGCKKAVDPPVGKPDPGKSADAFCVDGFTIAADGAYWIATSDQLVQDKVIYKDLLNYAAKDSHFTTQADQLSKETFITTAIATQIFRKGQPATSAAEDPKKSVEDALADVEARHQNRKLFQVDISKIVTGYSVVAPNLNDTAIGNDLSGVSATQATTPHSSEMDFEGLGRAVSAPFWKVLALGLQNDFEFDHKRTGNIQGKPATVVYSMNSETIGGFVQLHLPERWFIHDVSPNGIRSARNLPRAFIVAAPYQFQRQIVGTPLSFGYLTPPYTSNPAKNLTVSVPITEGFNWRLGFRAEAGGLRAMLPDAGSYVEIGPEYVVQNHILSGVSMPDLVGLTVPPGKTLTNPCLVTAGQSLSSCVQSAYKTVGATLNQSSHFRPQTMTLHAGGLYWMAHLQKIIDTKKQYSVSFDTTGDSYLLPGFTLPTQTRYSINNKLALNFNIFGNLSLSPTYSVFNFENQGITSQRISLNTTSFSIAAKWYFARDAAVPSARLRWFSGPKSADQTSSSKIK